MRKLFGIFGKRWFLTLLGTAALAVLVWFVGPLFGFADAKPLEGEAGRWIVIACLFGVWGLVQLWTAVAAWVRNRRVMETLASAQEQEPDAASVAAAEELETLKSRFAEATEVLKKSAVKHRLGGRYIYQLPWYVIIGPPGCGKTTALVNSGLQFPLAEHFGQDAIRGVGGTRNCDWWFTDEAVLLDTAGRYATQDSYEVVDSAAWQGFLGLLKQYRPRRPINGVLVCISLGDLMQQTQTETSIHARAIRQRVQELHQRLGVRFPVYALFMKADLIAGFMEMFGDFGEEERAQVWGMTFPLDEGQNPKAVIEGFSKEFSRLEERVNEHLLNCLQQERDPQKRRAIFAFPQQFASLRETADRFLREVFQPSRYEERPLVRGVYFTSGTQTGAPIDRVMSAMAANFRLDREGAQAFSGTGKSFFIRRLFRDVIFKEAGLAGTNLRLERRRKWVQRAAYAGAAAVALLAAAAWVTSYTRNRTYVAEVAAEVRSIESRIESLSPDDRDPLRILPMLNAVRGIPGGYGDRDEGTPLLMGAGLYQGDKLGSQATAAYRRILRKALLPRVILRLEDQIRAGAADPEYLYDVLRVYLMLDSPRHYDAETVQLWVDLDWDHNLPRETPVEEREQLKDHLAALLEERPAPLPLELDGALVAQAREILRRVPLAERIYARLQRDGLGDRVADFVISEASGDYANLVFERKSGKPLNQGVPALYTYDGYWSGFNLESKRLIAGAAEETWILGADERLVPGSEGLGELLREVRGLYLRDYVARWRELLADMDIVPVRNLDHAADILRVLADKEQSPLRRLLEAAAHQTMLDQRPGGAEGMVGKAGQTLSAFRDRVEGYFRDDSLPAAGAEAPESYVTRRFSQLHALVVAEDDQIPPIDGLLDELNQLYSYIKSVARAANSGHQALLAVKGEGTEVKELERAAGELPPPIDGWLGTLAQDSTNVISGGARAQLNNIWTAEVLPFCREALHDRYPLAKNSPREATLHDFGRLFGTGGLLDGFFQENLSPIVDTAGKRWAWLGGGIGIPDEVLGQFQRAAVIREAFFLAGGTTPAVEFEIKPLEMDPGATQFSLDLEGQIVDYRHGPPRISKLKWPGPEGPGRVRIVFVGVDGSRTSIVEEGPWAWFRMLDRSAMRATSQQELFHVTFGTANLRAIFELRAVSVRNPFRLTELRSFRCPGRL